jgi:hypothetical protein
MSGKYRCQLERIGAPHWTCGALVLALGLIMMALLADFLISMRTSPSFPRGLLAASAGVSVVGTILLVRGWRTLVSKDLAP